MKFLKNLLFIILLSLPLFGSEKIKIFILHSYSQEYGWTKNQHEGFVSALNKSNQKFEFYTEYLDTKRVKLTPEYERNFFKYLKNRYQESTPDVIYVTDDNALEFIFKNYKELFTNSAKIPLFFSGINNLEMQNILPSEQFAGVYETKEIKPNIELIKQFSPQTRDIYFVGDNSSTYLSIKKEIQIQQENFKNLNFYFISDEHLSVVQTMLPSTARSFVFLTTIGNFKDDSENTLLVEESIEKIKENKNLIILSMEDAYMLQGVVGGYVTSGNKQGEEAANLVLQYLDAKSLLNVKSLLKSPNIYMFNSKELINSRIILSEYIARDATFVGKHQDFIEKNQSILLNIFTIALIISIFGAVTTFALQRKRCKKQSTKMQQLENIKSTLHLKEQFIDNLLSFKDVGFWKLDTKTDKLFVSEELLNILEIKYDIYKDDSKLLSYFVHLDDKQLFEEKLNIAKESKSPIKFSHKMFTSSNQVLHATHLIYTEFLNQEPSLLIGIIKFEK
ncbi:MAG: diguanylate cyclase [Campylobacterales bacterium]|nr:diguanylate cyclase [Campylobacterales bacterium]